MDIHTNGSVDWYDAMNKLYSVIHCTVVLVISLWIAVRTVFNRFQLQTILIYVYRNKQLVSNIMQIVVFQFTDFVQNNNHNFQVSLYIIRWKFTAFM